MFDSTSGRNAHAVIPWAVISVSATTVAERGPLSISAISPKKSPSPSVRMLLAAAADTRGTRLDQEEADAVLALDRDLLAGGEATRAEVLRDPPQLLVAHAREQRHALEIANQLGLSHRRRS